jgi:hypothetical protein
MPELTTVPMFVFKQGDPFAGDGNCEYPIEVKYYNGCICFDQEGNSINISPAFAKALFREVLKHLPEAENKLKQ